ncbi:MAG: hypothetical protein ACYDER_07950 [Ktedonobacteraceae bacterium]
MASFLRKAHRGSCYCCRQSAVSEAYGATICMRHHILISLRVCTLLARHGRLGPFWHSPLSCITHCPWCWRDAEIMCDFPAPWSSTICAYHRRQVCAQAKTRRLARHLSTAAATHPVAVGLQAHIEEVQR